MPLFGGVRADILQFLLGLCPVVPVPTNEFFFREHDEADSMFVLEAGKAAVLKSWRGQEYLLRTLKEGDCFGEMAVMDLLPRSASVRAVEDCTAIRLSAANLYQGVRAGSEAVYADPDEHGPGGEPKTPGVR
jgi:CRP-like cAMP-binding protein